MYRLLLNVKLAAVSSYILWNQGSPQIGIDMQCDKNQVSSECAWNKLTLATINSPAALNSPKTLINNMHSGIFVGEGREEGDRTRKKVGLKATLLPIQNGTQQWDRKGTVCLIILGLLLPSSPMYVLL